MMANQSRRRPGPSRAVSSTHASIRQAAFFLGILYTIQMTRAQSSRCLDPDLLPPALHLRPFAQPLLIPEVKDISTGAQLTLGGYKFNQSVHPDLPNTTFYGYGTSQDTATYPGPTLVAKRGVSSSVRFENHITGEHIFQSAVDDTIHMAQTPNSNTQVPMVTHLHGAEAAGQYDGHPEAWFTAAGATGPKFVAMNNTYPNDQPATLLWYHDHSLGWTRLNVAAGLAGLYIIRDESKEPADLPQGDFEVPLVLQDRRFFGNGSIFYPTVGNDHPHWCPDYFGDTILVNGRAWPFLNVTRNIYRFRMLNGANGRVFNLTFNDVDGNKLPVYQIGTDGGFLWNTTSLETLILPPAYRVDLLVDFRDVPVNTVLYLNNSQFDAEVGDPPDVRDVMQFRVVGGSGRTNDTVKVPVPQLQGSVPAPPLEAFKARANATTTPRFLNLTIPVGRLMFALNDLHYNDTLSETPQLGTVEIWNLVHCVDRGVHPVHIHLVNFLVVHQQDFDLTGYKNNNCRLDRPYQEEGSCYTGEPKTDLDPMHMGWKDTALVLPGTVLQIVVPMFPRRASENWPNIEPYPFNATESPGYVWHCHNLDHEDNDMMRPLQFLAQAP